MMAVGLGVMLEVLTVELLGVVLVLVWEQELASE